MKSLHSSAIFIVGFLPIFAASAAPLDATVQFANRAEMSMTVSGRIKSVNVKPGQRVQAGEVMIALDPVPFEALVAQAEADVITKTTLEKEAKRDYDQIKELYDRGVASTVELQNAENNFVRQQAALLAAQAKLSQAKYNLEHSEIVAPADGWVLNVFGKLNESVNNSNEVHPLVVFAEKSQYKAHLNVGIGTSRNLKIGQTSTVTVGGRNYKGAVIAVSLEPVDGKSNSYPVEVLFSSGDRLLHGGEAAKVEF